MIWKPTIDDNIQRIEEKIQEIYNVIKSQNKDKLNFGLMSGKGGLALFCFHFAKIYDNQEAYDLGYDLLEEIIENISQDIGNYSFCNGLAGISWLVNHLENEKLVEINSFEIVNEINSLLPFALYTQISKSHWDYLHGASGCLFSLILDSKDPKNSRAIKTYVQKLYEAAIFDEDGCVKWQDDKYFVSKGSGLEGECAFNLGLAHGMPSIIYFLHKCFKSGIEVEATKELINACIKYHMKFYSLDNMKKNSFPHAIIKDKIPSYDGRLGWCYGDLGVVMALWQTIDLVEDKMIKAKLIQVIDKSLDRRNLNSALIFDAGLCHGSSSLVHLYNKFFNLTGKNEYRVASNFWINVTLDMAKYIDGFAGYKTYLQKKLGGPVPELGLLSGVAGIGLTLISSVREIKPSWDSSLLLS